MSPLFRFAIRFIIAFAIIMFAIQPFNWFCSITQKCRPFYFSYYIPKVQGSIPVNVALEVINFREDVDFAPSVPSLTTFTNTKNLITYHAKNRTKKPIRFRPLLVIQPEYAEKYLVRYECLCFREYKLKPGEEVEMRMEFEIDRKIEKDNSFISSDKSLKIRYKI